MPELFGTRFRQVLACVCVIDRRFEWTMMAGKKAAGIVDLGRLLSVVPIIPVHEGDFLGVFAGRFGSRKGSTTHTVSVAPRRTFG